MINVTKSYLPNRDKFKTYIDKIFDSGWLTNRGSMLLELERRLAEYLNVKNVVVVANGSLALQVAYKALGLKGKAITTPFSFAATASTLNWEGIEPVFSDIDAKTLNLSPEFLTEKDLIEASALVPVHVFGNPCDVEKFDQIAEKYNLKVVYDAAHAFGVNWNGQSILRKGDISTLSFHSTKLFHCIEGGAIITEDDELADKCRKLINFGITGPSTIEGQGTNAKMNEFEAAMGLCVLDEIDVIYRERQTIWSMYVEELKDFVSFQTWSDKSDNRHAYAPILLNNETEVLTVERALKDKGITPRRYFYPSLNECDYSQRKQSCPTSENVARRILCLPIYPGLSEDDVINISGIIKQAVKANA